MSAGLLKWIFLLTVGSNQAQDPRRRLQVYASPPEALACAEPRCFLKRSLAAPPDEMGPFWANRGKKDPTYLQEALYAEEPYWVLVRRDDRYQQEPFFISRGKKLGLRERRKSSLQDVVDSPFFAARGKRTEQADD